MLVMGILCSSCVSNYLFMQQKNVGVFHHCCRVSYVDFLLYVLYVPYDVLLRQEWQVDGIVS